MCGSPPTRQRTCYSRVNMLRTGSRWQNSAWICGHGRAMSRCRLPVLNPLLPNAIAAAATFRSTLIKGIPAFTSMFRFAIIFYTLYQRYLLYLLVRPFPSAK